MTKAGCSNIYASALSDHVDPHFTSYHSFDLLLYQYSEQLNLIHTLIVSIHLCNCQESSEVYLEMRKRKASSDLSRTKNKKPEVADSVTIIDGDGDLQIDLTDDWGNLQGLLVNRHVLRLASPVFAAMFAKDSPFEESRNRVTNDNSVQVVKFEDDDFGAMCIIMNVIHFQGHRVPRELPLNGLDIIASLCDKYDLSSHLGPWGHLWAKQFLQEGAHGHCNRLLRISVAMKLPEEYTFITRHLIQYATLSDKGTLKIGDESIDGDSDFTEAVPDYILGEWPGLGTARRLTSNRICN